MERKRAWPRVVAVTALAILVGIFLGGHSGWMPGWLAGVFAPENPQVKQVQQVLALVNSDYYRPVDDQRLTNIALQSAIAALGDPYSHYVPAAQQQQFTEETQGQESGIGVVVSPEPKGLEIAEVYPGSPAQRAGIGQGDVIVAVGGRSIAASAMNWEAATNLIRGPAGTQVRLTVLRGGHTRTVTVTRRTIFVPVATSQLIHYHGAALGYVDFSQFTEGSADQLRRQVKAMLRAGAQGLILDLRENPGGLVDQAVGVASLFIPNGTIVSTRGRNQPATVYTALGDAIAPKIPLVVLVDRGTASAAEIVTAALQERRGAEVVGTRTYGKGVFQESQTLPWGAILDITVGQFYTPDGHNLGGSGVTAGRSVTRGPGIRPNVYVAKASQQLRRAEQVLRAEIGR
jgi:carboxyl-terminal processing protease